MSEVLKIVLTAIFGIVIFVIGQITQRIFIEPIQDQRRVLGRIAHALRYFQQADELADEGAWKATEPTEVVFRKLWDLAAELDASYRVIPLYWLMTTFALVEPHERLIEISLRLTQWAKSLDTNSAERWKRMTALRELIMKPN